MDIKDFRKYICSHLDEAIKVDPTFFPECIVASKDKGAKRFRDEIEGTPKEWKKRMGKNKVHADEIMFMLSSDYLKREIVLHLVGSGFDKWVYKPNGSMPFEIEPMNLLYFSQTRFGVGHFQSIRPVQQNMNNTKEVDKDNSSISDPLFESTKLEGVKRKGSKRKRKNESNQENSRQTRSRSKLESFDNMTLRSTRSKSNNSEVPKSKSDTKTRSKSASSNKRARR